MGPSVVVDTGPIVALLDASEANHAWAVARFEELRPPLLTCEPVLTEASYLMARAGAAPGLIVDLVTRGVVTTVSLLPGDAASIRRLMQRYASAPMSFADAYLVRMIESTPNATLLTLDSVFRVYRQQRRRVIPLLIP